MYSVHKHTEFGETGSLEFVRDLCIRPHFKHSVVRYYSQTKIKIYHLIYLSCMLFLCRLWCRVPARAWGWEPDWDFLRGHSTFLL